MHSKQPKRKIVGKLEWVAIIAIILLVGYMVLNTFGIHLVETTEETQMHQRATDHRNKTDFVQHKMENQLDNARAERLLSGFVEELQEKDGEKPGDEDMEFLKEIAKKSGIGETVEKTQKRMEWLHKSYKAYQAVKDFTGSRGGREGGSELERLLDVPKEHIKKFDRNNPATNEWADYIWEHLKER